MVVAAVENYRTLSVLKRSCILEVNHVIRSRYALMYGDRHSSATCVWLIKSGGPLLPGNGVLDLDVLGIPAPRLNITAGQDSEGRP